MNTSSTTRSEFGSKLYSKLAGTQTGNNVFFSPFSIQVALAMIAMGARGETRQDLIDLIGAPENVEEQNQHYARLLKSVYGDGKRPFELVTANALWGQQGFHFHAVFQVVIGMQKGPTLGDQIGK